MKKALLATAALGTVFIGGSSLAADFGIRAPAPVPVFTWTGCYIGVHGGAGWTDKTVSVPSIVPGESVTGHTFGALAVVAKSAAIFNLAAG